MLLGSSREGSDMSEREYKIIAVDFDGTLCENRFPEIGKPNFVLIEGLRELRRAGNKIILWTCRVDHWLEEAVGWCKALGLEFDEVNNNLPEKIEKWGNDTRKIYADIYIDDKAMEPPGLWLLGIDLQKERSRGKK